MARPKLASTTRRSTAVWCWFTPHRVPTAGCLKSSPRIMTSVSCALQLSSATKQTGGLHPKHERPGNKEAQARAHPWRLKTGPRWPSSEQCWVVQREEQLLAIMRDKHQPWVVWSLTRLPWRACNRWMDWEALGWNRPLWGLPAVIVTWLILPVVICLSQRLSHACLSINNFVL